MSALAAADIIKDDHGLTNQKTAPFKKRVEKVATAVARANAETGGHSLYFPNIARPSDQLLEFAHFAKQAGADGALVMPGLNGFDLTRRLAAEEGLNLPSSLTRPFSAVTCSRIRSASPTP